MTTSPGWLNTISPHAVITRAELLLWLGVSVPELRLLLRDQGLPPPRFGKWHALHGRFATTSTCRWRVGDVRAWLEDSSNLKKELATQLAAESTQSEFARESLQWVMEGKVKQYERPPARRIGENDGNQ